MAKNPRIFMGGSPERIVITKSGIDASLLNPGIANTIFDSRWAFSGLLKLAKYYQKNSFGISLANDRTRIVNLPFGKTIQGPYFHNIYACYPKNSYKLYMDEQVYLQYAGVAEEDTLSELFPGEYWLKALGSGVNIEMTSTGINIDLVLGAPMSTVASTPAYPTHYGFFVVIIKP